MQGSKFFMARYLEITEIGWCITAGLLFWKLMQRPWRQSVWVRCLLCGIAAGLGATVALIPLQFATAMLVVLALRIGGLGLLLLLPLLLILGVVLAIWRAITPRPS